MKFIIIEDSGEGKTCLIQQYSTKEFTPIHLATIAAGDKRLKEVKVGNKEVKLEIWDSAVNKYI